MAELPSIVECARLWLSPPVGAFWRWSDGEDAVEWTSGGTILLRQEIAQLAAHRAAAGQGLPQLQAVVFLMALLRERERTLRLVPDIDLPPTAALWERVRRLPFLRLHLVDAALHGLVTNSPEFAARVAKGLAGELPQGLLAEREFRAETPAVIARWLQVGLRGITEERLDLWGRTGVDEVPILVDLPLAERPVGDSLLTQLQQDSELSGLVGVVRQIMAAMRLPYAALRRDEQPTGGFAGVSNRGSLDHLLPSELAHDDEVLAVRIATNEALYVQREVPPYEPRSRRRILLDDGVRMWGAPRVLGVAVALALQATAHGGRPCEVFRSDAGRLVAVDLSQRARIVEQLERTDWALDARGAVAEFLAHEDPDAELVEELILVAHRDAFADPEYLRGHRPHGRQRCYLAELDDAGGFRMLEVTLRGSEELSTAQLQLESLRRRSMYELPDFYSFQPTPFRSIANEGNSLSGLIAVSTCAAGIVLHRYRGTRLLLHQSKNGQRVIAGPTELPDLVGPAPFGAFWQHSAKVPLMVAELGSDWLVYHDAGGFLHFVSRAMDKAEVTLHLSLRNGLRGWSSETRSYLEGRALGDCLRAIAEAVQ